MTAISAETFDPLLVSDEFLYDPYPLLHRLRAEAPILWSDAIGGWVITRFDDVMVTFRDVQHFSNAGRLGRAVEYLPPDQRAQLPAFEAHYATVSLIHSDPPDHTRLRALVNKAFTPRVVEALRPRIAAVVDELLDAAPAAGPLDLIRHLANPLPAIIIAEIMGAAPEDRQHFKTWADDILAFQGVNRPSLPTLLQSQRGIVEMRAYLTEKMAERRRRPQADLLSQLVAAEADGERLSEAELLSTCLTFLVAGHETTTSLIGNGLLSLLQHPAQLGQLRADPALLPAAIEEMLRFESPVSRQPRLIRADVVLGGQHLRAGQMAFQFLNAANRDPAVFPEPDRFDLRRANNRHIAFGLGLHFCVGAPLARLEGPIAIDAVLRRMPKLRLASDTADWDTGKRNSRLLRTLMVEP